MGQIVSLVRGVVAPDRLAALEADYRAGLVAGLPSGIVRTYLLRGPSGEVAIATVWRDQAALDAIRASGEEPLARRLIREAGSEPTVDLFEVLAEAAH